MSALVSPAEHRVVMRLHRAVAGLPDRVRVREFHSLQSEIRELATDLQLKHRLSYEHALVIAGEHYLDQPRAMNRQLRQMWQGEIATERGRRRQADSEPHPTPEPADNGSARLNADLVARFGADGVRWMTWSRDLDPSWTYLGGVDVDGVFVWAVGLEVHEEGARSLEPYLRQRGVLAEELTQGRTVAFCAAPLIDTPYFCDVGTCDLAWSPHEALIRPLRTSIKPQFAELTDLDLAAVAYPLCHQWLQAQGVPEAHIVTTEREMNSDALWQGSSFERWGYSLTDLEKLSEIRCYLDKPWKVAGFTLRVPHVDLGQLAWPLFCVFLLLMVALGWGVSQVDWSSVTAPASSTAPPYAAETVPAATDMSYTYEMTWRDWAWALGIGGVIVGLLSLPFIVLYRLAETLAYFLWTRTLLGIPYKRRFPYDERFG